MERSRLTWREFLVHSLILLALLAPAYPGVFCRGELISSADMLFMLPPWDKYAPEGFSTPKNKLMFDPLMAFRPDYRLVQEELRNGEWPLWNPLEYSGVPLLANCQSTAFYPPRLLLAFLDVDTAMTVFVLLKLWLCGATAYLCVRLLGLSRLASRFFSVAWMLGSYCLIWSNWPLTDVSCWVPIVFLGVEFTLDGQYRRGFFALACGATLLLLAGHPETAFTMSLGLGFYFVARLIWERRWGKAFWAPVAVCVGAWALVALVYVIQALPFLEYLTNSYTYSERAETKLDIPLPAGTLVTFWVPRFFGTWAEYTFWDKGKWNSNITGQQYAGMAVWCGIMLLLARITPSERPSRERARIACLLIAGTLGSLLAFNLSSLAWVHELPLFSSLLKIYHMCFPLFVIPLLGAIGLDRWFSRRRKPREALWIAPLVVLVVLLVWVLFSFNRGLISTSKLTDYVHTQIWIAAVSAVIAIAVLVASTLVYRPRVLWAALTVVLIVDLVVAARGLNPTLPRKYVFPDTELTRFLQAQEKPCRMGVAEAFIISGAVSNYGIEEWLGYDGLFSERPIRFQTELGPDVWRAMEPVYSVQYYIIDPNFDPMFPLEELKASGALERAAVLDGLEVYKNNRTFPRARLVAEAEVIADRDALFARMLEEGFDPKRTTVTQVAPSVPLPRAKNPDLGSAAITEYKANRVTVDVNAAEDAILVLSDAYYPGWQALLDGQRTDMFPAYYVFRGVVVPAGNHTVSFVYRPQSLRIGLALSIVGLVVGLLLAVGALRRRPTIRGGCQYDTPSCRN